MDVSEAFADWPDMSEEFSSCFMRKLWWLEMVNFIEVLEGIGVLVGEMWICMSMSIWNGF